MKIRDRHILRGHHFRLIFSIMLMVCGQMVISQGGPSMSVPIIARPVHSPYYVDTIDASNVFLDFNAFRAILESQGAVFLVSQEDHNLYLVKVGNGHSFYINITNIFKGHPYTMLSDLLMNLINGLGYVNNSGKQFWSVRGWKTIVLNLNGKIVRIGNESQDGAFLGPLVYTLTLTQICGDEFAHLRFHFNSVLTEIKLSLTDQMVLNTHGVFTRM
ncbi:hypothetical protein Q0M94_21540 (plasmid) [Deinococcus radiomollis]|uniref:hypothetical protein n=1 Tax=Deinococcus radiomollis TaxID=468916 RepID=UPI0038915592